MKAAVTLTVTLVCLVAAPFASGGVVQTAKPSLEKVTGQLAKDVQELLQRNISSFHVLLRDLSLTVGPRCVGRPWTTVAKELDNQGFRVTDTWENGSAINCHYLIKTNAFVTPAGYPMDLYLMLQAENLDFATPTQHAGRVISAAATLVANVRLPFAALAAQARFPKGSVMDRALAIQEVKEVGASWPLVRRVYASYDFLFDRWAEHSPSGFRVTVEFETDPEDIGVKTLTYIFVSGLDPPKSKTGGPVVATFMPKDSLGDATQTGNNESWRGDDKTIEEAKAKYLRRQTGLYLDKRQMN
jgi:hypothetical protein